MPRAWPGHSRDAASAKTGQWGEGSRVDDRVKPGHDDLGALETYPSAETSATRRRQTPRTRSPPTRTALAWTARSNPGVHSAWSSARHWIRDGGQLWGRYRHPRRWSGRRTISVPGRDMPLSCPSAWNNSPKQWPQPGDEVVTIKCSKVTPTTDHREIYTKALTKIWV